MWHVHNNNFRPTKKCTKIFNFLSPDNPLQRNYQNQLSHPSLSHTEKEFQKSFWLKERFTSNHIGKKTSVLKKLYNLCDAKLSGLCASDMSISLSPKQGKNQKGKLRVHETSFWWLIWHKKWHPGTSGIPKPLKKATVTHFHQHQSTKINLVFSLAYGEASRLLLPCLAWSLSGCTMQ